MIPPVPWKQRSFTSGLPAGVLPAVLERLRGTPARAADLVAGHPEALLGMRFDGKWSVKEHLGHLDDLADLDERRLREFLAGLAALSPADMANRATEAANHNGTPLAAILERLRARRLEWVHKLDRLDFADASRTALHPRLQKPMQLVDWLYFVAEHDDHHLAHASQLIQSRIATPAINPES